MNRSSWPKSGLSSGPRMATCVTQRSSGCAQDKRASRHSSQRLVKPQRVGRYRLRRLREHARPTCDKQS